MDGTQLGRGNAVVPQALSAAYAIAGVATVTPRKRARLLGAYTGVAGRHPEPRCDVKTGRPAPPKEQAAEGQRRWVRARVVRAVPIIVSGLPPTGIRPVGWAAKAVGISEGK
jgi:hypothetical protein